LFPLDARKRRALGKEATPYPPILAWAAWQAWRYRTIHPSSRVLRSCLTNITLRLSLPGVKGFRQSFFHKPHLPWSEHLSFFGVGSFLPGSFLSREGRKRICPGQRLGRFLPG